MFKSNRKKVAVAGIFAGLLVLSVFAITGTAMAGDPVKVGICHCTNGTPEYLFLSVSSNAWEDSNGNKHSPEHHQCTTPAGIPIADIGPPIIVTSQADCDDEVPG